MGSGSSHSLKKLSMYLCKISLMYPALEPDKLGDDSGASLMNKPQYLQKTIFLCKQVLGTGSRRIKLCECWQSKATAKS